MSRYRILEAIGEGGMGEVFLAVDEELERKVALKFLRRALHDDARALKRLHREAKSAAALDHPFICKVYEVGEIEGQAFICMEYVQGETLERRLERGPLSLEEGLRVSVEIAEALTKAHEVNIVHRDLKPANVMLDLDGHVKVMDFGVAKQILEPGHSEAETREGKLTEAGSLVGTPSYMSPEQLCGDPVDAGSDLFALGILVQEMLTGVHPFERKSVAETLSAILKEPPLGDHELPGGLEFLVGRLLSKKAADRPGAVEVRGELQTFSSQPELLNPKTLSRKIFVGRQSERSELSRLVRDLESSHGSLVLLGGEPGVGKTRLCEEALSEATEEGFLSLEGHCYEMEGGQPFIPFVESLERVRRIRGREDFREVLGESAPEMAKLMPELRRLYDDIPEPIPIAPELQLRYLFNSFQELMERLAGKTPIVWLLDDLHWADESSLLLLQHLAQGLKQVPILILGTYRDVELEVGKPFANVLAQLVRKRLAHRIGLKRLTEDAVGEFLSALAGSPPPPSLVRGIYHETEGNPFFVEEVFRHLSEEGKLFDESGQWETDLKVHELEVPEGVRLVIGRRLARLSEQTRKVLTAAAVMGRLFELELLETFEEFDGDEVLDALEQAETAELVVALPKQRETRYKFSHELIRQTLVSSLSIRRQQRLHLRVADAMERSYGNRVEEHASDLAYHLYQAGSGADAAKTIRYLLLASRQALESAAHLEAIALLSRGLALLEDEPDGSDENVQELELLVALGPPLLATKGFSSPEVERTYARARELCREVGETPHLFPVLWGLFMSNMTRARFDTSRELGDQLLSLAERHGDSALLLPSHQAVGMSAFYTGVLEPSAKHFEQSVALYDSRQHRTLAFRYGQDFGMMGLNYGSWILWFLGYADQARAKSEEALSLAQGLSHPFSETYALSSMTRIHHFCRDPHACCEWAERMIALADEHGFEQWSRSGWVWQGWARVELGQTEEGISQMCDGLNRLRAMGVKLWLPYYLGLLADAYRNGNRVEEGLSELQEARSTVEETGERFYEAELYRLEGELLLLRPADRRTEAEACFERALQIAQSRKARALSLRAANSLARLRAARGESEEAHQLLAPIYNDFTEGFDTADLVQAKELLDVLID